MSSLLLLFKYNKAIDDQTIWLLLNPEADKDYFSVLELNIFEIK